MVDRSDDREDSSATLCRSSQSDEGDHDQTTLGCGLGPCRSRCLQIFAKPIIFLILLNIYCIVEGAIVNGKEILSYWCCNSVNVLLSRSNLRSTKLIATKWLQLSNMCLCDPCIPTCS